jgi:hypothetical protein
MPFIVGESAKAVDRVPRLLEKKSAEFASGCAEKNAGAKLYGYPAKHCQSPAEDKYNCEYRCDQHPKPESERLFVTPKCSPVVVDNSIRYLPKDEHSGRRS